MPYKDYLQTDFHHLPGGRFILKLGLCRPKAINALNLEMVEGLYQQLIAYQTDKNLYAIFLYGSGERGFCAGGDIKLFYQSAMCQENRGEKAQQFFCAEYKLDALLADYPVPVICWANGIVMGGGLGLLWAASHRVLFADSVIAMPEISIGLYPDAGGSFYLNQLEPEFARFIALTGKRLNAADFSCLGYRSWYLHETSAERFFENLDELYTTVCNISSSELLDKALEMLSRKNEQSSFIQKFEPVIRQLFASADIRLIDGKLRDAKLRDKPEALDDAITGYLSGSPLSAWAIVKQLEYCRKNTLQHCLESELQLSMRCLMEGDLAEGVRALVIDKDNLPQWKFSGLDFLDDPPGWFPGQ